MKQLFDVIAKLRFSQFSGSFSLLLLLLSLASTLAANNTEQAIECFFIPPKGWEIADPSTLSPRVKMAFLKKSNKHFCPSINLAIEETESSLNEYIKAVKAIHERDRKNHWRTLGKVRTAAGLAQLTEIDSPSDWGKIRMLQLILIKNKHAYVLTAAALTEDFPEHYKEFQSAFRSLELTTDLVSCIPQLERREKLKNQQQELLSSPDQWTSFQSSILDNFTDMGAFWQVLILRAMQERLQDKVSPVTPPESIPICKLTSENLWEALLGNPIPRSTWFCEFELRESSQGVNAFKLAKPKETRYHIRENFTPPLKHLQRENPQ